MCWNANSPRNMRKSGWPIGGPDWWRNRCSWVRVHVARLVATPSWAWHPERHAAGCRYAALLHRLGIPG